MKELRSDAIFAVVNLFGILAAEAASYKANEKLYREETERLKNFFEESRRTDWQKHVASAEAILNE